jgi:hypothetical protein
MTEDNKEANEGVYISPSVASVRRWYGVFWIMVIGAIIAILLKVFGLL